ncbi:MAG: hypothetical protein FJ116_11475 [Deltaproteobacteria bacterium]|nr:hypothetical protein [Deltaproteobacteria bacterium]
MKKLAENMTSLLSRRLLRTALSILVISRIAAAEVQANRNATALAEYERNCRGSGSLGFLLDRDDHAWSSTAPERTLENLQEFIRANRVTSPTALLTQFRRADNHQWPQNSVLLSHSESAQSDLVDRKNPRILVYGNGLILGMTGHSGANSSSAIAESNNQVEVIRYNQERKVYQFALLDFNQNPPTLREETSCLRCHGNPPRPIWQPLTFWDHLTRVNQRTEFQRPNSIYSALGNESMDNWQNLLNFTSYLDHLSLRYTASTFTSSRDYSRFRYATLAAVLGCENIPGYLGAEAVNHERIAGTMALLTQNTQGVIERNNQLARNFGNSPGFEHIRNRITTSSLNTADTERIAALRLIFEGRKISLSHLSTRRARVTQRNPYGYGFLSSGSVPELGTQELACFLLPEAVRADRRLAPLVARRSSHGPLGVAGDESECALLLRLSLEAIRGPGGQRSNTSPTSTIPAH